MRAAWYERQGPAAEVRVVGEMPNPEPGPKEVRIRVAASGINPGDVKKRHDKFGVGIALSRHGGATVLAAVRSQSDRIVAQRAGAHHVLVLAGHQHNG